MGAFLLVAMLLLGAVYLAQAAVAVHVAAGGKRRHAVLEAAAAALGVPLFDRQSHIMGYSGGVPITFSMRGLQACVELDLPTADLILLIRPRLVAAGRRPPPLEEASAFDAEMIVEGAPRDVVRSLLGAEVRAALLAERPLEVSFTGTTLEITAEPLGADDVRRLLDLALALAAAVPVALDEADRRVTEVMGSPYRPEVDSAALRSARDARAGEVGVLLATWEERARAVRRALVLGGVLLGLLVLSLATS